MIKASENFYFNGSYASDFGIINVNIDSSGMIQEPFFSNRTLNKTKLKYKDNAYFQNIQTDVKQIELQLAFSDEIVVTNSLKRAVQRWLLDTTGYKELWFEQDCQVLNDEYDITKPKRIYMATVVNNSMFNHFNLPAGYFNVTFETNSDICYSLERGNQPYKVMESEDETEDSSKIYFFNHSDFLIKPQIKIQVGHVPGTDENNQSIKMTSHEIDDLSLGGNSELNDNFRRIYDVQKTDFSKFPPFEFSEGKSASGIFQLLGTIFYGEKFILGNNTYEFDLGYGKPYNKLETSNIMVPVFAKKASNILVFNENSWVNDGSTITIGNQCFEFDSNDLVSPQAVKVDISNYVDRGKARLYLNSNLMPGETMKVGDINYEFMGGTREDIIKMTDHLLTDGSEINYLVNTDRNTLVSDNVNISTKKLKDVDKCLVRNISKNPSDIGIRKMGYWNKDFVRVLWDSESNEDYQQEINNVPILGRIIITFDNQVDEKTINNDTIQIRDIEGKLIDCTHDISKDKKVIGVTPKTPYSYDNYYYLYVSKGVKDIKGESFHQVRKIKVHTKKENDTTIDKYDGVSPIKTFSIYSAQKIDSSTLSNNVYVVEEGSSIHYDVNINLVDSGKIINVSPKNRYGYGKTYELHVGVGIKNVDGTAILGSERIIDFTVQTEVNETHVDNDFIPLSNVPISETIKIPFDGKLDSGYVNNSLVGNAVILQDGDKIQVYIDININSIAPNILDITPKKALKYNSYYFLYISQALKLDGKSNISAPLQYKLITETEASAKNIINSDANNELTTSETGDKSLLQIDLGSCNTDKVITYHYNAPLDTSTINNTNVWVKDCKGNKVDIIVEPTTDNTGIQIFPSPVWENGESYKVYINNQVKTSSKPRVFAGSVPPDGDYENAVNIFGKYFDVIKTNGFKVQENNIIDHNGNQVVFTKNDIVFQNNYGIKKEDLNDDGSVKDGTSITSIPAKGINTENAKNLASTDRVATKIAMQEKMNEIQGQSWITQQLVNEDTEIVTFNVKDNNERILIDVDSSIILESSNIKNEVVKKIVGMTPGDDINLYEESDMDFCIDPNSLVPSTIPVGAKVYAGKSTDKTNATDDDYTNACKILAPLGYTVIDTTSMTLEDKKKALFKPFDIVIGGVLAGTKPSDFDPKTGNLLTSKPSETDTTDTRTTRVTGMPMEVNIYPAIRLQGSANNPGREGTKLAMQEFADRYNKEKKGGELGEYTSNICPKGVTLMYKVPSGSNVYGAGADYYNAIRYLNSFGFNNFVNVGVMTDAQKQAIGFTKNDIIVGGVQASDTATTNTGQSVTVTGIGAIPLNGALRLGGVDRYDTEAKIKAYSESLRIKTIEAGDIVKLKIKINNPNNMIIDSNKTASGDDVALENSNETIDENIRIEYHIVKSVTPLSRNRVHIDFYENIRTIGFISEIEITDLYKLYETRTAEDYLFSGSYQIKIGDDKNKTMLNIVKAINGTGVYGVEYSQYTFKHSIVLGQIASENEIELDAIEAGTKGNIPVSLVDKLDPKNRFLTSSLEGGKDCTQSDAIKALAKTILEQNDKKERYNKDKYDVTYDATTLTITHKMCGEKYNDIICLANVNQQIQMPYIITNTGVKNVDNGSLINLKDFLNREKQVAKWKNFTLIGGEDPKAEDCVITLVAKIKEKHSAEIITTYFKKDDGTDDKTGFNIEYAKVGEIGNNAPLDTTCVNGRLSGKKLKGGLDGLQVGEVITIDNERQIIESSLKKNRYKNFNNNWLSVPLDGVMLRVRQGNFTITFAYREKYYI
ncbi:hypothetical protein HBE96_00380 [Clostridium sp. P21]|uniref:SbsA Ig-like domain-containing protein n=1 Tax=Clostridium muellerianum TaxID=2716538 RepID=A0A7Y0ED32_9CLOT|nr:Ig-like domain-containing protein [Clostridium muellerianum]NMM61183.1 hypothetical protein [Clostridium muellerianum]